MRTLAIALVLASTSALACPDLSGKYAACRSITGGTSGSTDVVISQSVQNRVTVYSMTGTDNETHERSTETYRADGRTVSTTQSDPESGMSFQVSQTTSCNGTKSLMIKTLVGFNGQNVAQVNMNISKSGNKGTMVSTGTNMGEPVNETVVCE